MTYRELTRFLSRNGCSLFRNAKGSHKIWINRASGAKTTVPDWGSRDLKPGTVSGILKDLGLRGP